MSDDYDSVSRCKSGYQGVINLEGVSLIERIRASSREFEHSVIFHAGHVLESNSKIVIE